jgi:arylsulfatase A-like enzyme
VTGTQWDVFDPGQIPVPANVPAAAAAQAEADLADYYSMAHALDAAVGSVLDHLDVLEIADETVVIFTADHGAHIGAHAPPGEKRTFYEEAVHVPLVIRDPDVPAGVSDALFGTVDFKVLIMERVGLPLPPSLHGLKHVPGSLYFQQYDPENTIDGAWRGILRDDGMKYAVSEGSPSGWMMFDTLVDSLEMNNLVGLGDPREAEMLALLQQAAALVGDVLP